MEHQPIFQSRVLLFAIFLWTIGFIVNSFNLYFSYQVETDSLHGHCNKLPFCNLACEHFPNLDTIFAVSEEVKINVKLNIGNVMTDISTIICSIIFLVKPQHKDIIIFYMCILAVIRVLIDFYVVYLEWLIEDHSQAIVKAYWKSSHSECYLDAPEWVRSNFQFIFFRSCANIICFAVSSLQTILIRLGVEDSSSPTPVLVYEYHRPRRAEISDALAELGPLPRYEEAIHLPIPIDVETEDDYLPSYDEAIVRLEADRIRRALQQERLRMRNQEMNENDDEGLPNYEEVMRMDQEDDDRLPTYEEAIRNMNISSVTGDVDSSSDTDDDSDETPESNDTTTTTLSSNSSEEVEQENDNEPNSEQQVSQNN